MVLPLSKTTPNPNPKPATPTSNPTQTTQQQQFEIPLALKTEIKSLLDKAYPNSTKKFNHGIPDKKYYEDDPLSVRLPRLFSILDSLTTQLQQQTNIDCGTDESKLAGQSCGSVCGTMDGKADNYKVDYEEDNDKEKNVGDVSETGTKWS
ncbi:unnamed protein product [Ambrosiozyma monospora]|uniref:Unnamed protein product n=1 Tax=Ambrosiozyma monospora TaxID=43982 RepID=A0ACB5U8Z7_AMBMO|nr:unnamed protein product [Ambrosiozyma monospora]